MFTCTSGLLLAILVAAAPAEVQPDSVKIITKDKNGNPIPRVQLKIDGGDPPITTGDKGEVIIPLKGKRITIQIDPKQRTSMTWKEKTFEIPEQEVTLTIEKVRLQHPAPPSVAYAPPPCPGSDGYEGPRCCIVETYGECCWMDSAGDRYSSPYTICRSLDERRCVYVDTPCDSCRPAPCNPTPCCKPPAAHFSQSDLENFGADGLGAVPTGEAKLTLSVPSDAHVFINGKPTKSTGERRVYLSKGLASNYGYRYDVAVRAVRNGETIENSRTIVLHAGESRSMSLDSPAETPNKMRFFVNCQER
jgi:uncharacterized protein (TIGR03000 family)